MKKKLFYLIGIVVFFVIFLNYNIIDNSLEKFFDIKEYVYVERIIDGDTIETKNKTIRLLGINTPERGEKYYEEAKEFLEQKILEKTIKLEYGNEKTDRYGRTLGYIYFNGTNINKEIIEKGLGNIYFPSGKTFYYNDFRKAWDDCIKNNINLCKKTKSICGKCIKIENIDIEKDVLELKNSCNIMCDLENWSIKDEGRKKFVFENIILGVGESLFVITGKGNSSQNHLYWDEHDYVWTKTGDSIFLRDKEGKLVDWKNW